MNIIQRQKLYAHVAHVCTFLLKAARKQSTQHCEHHPMSKPAKDNTHSLTATPASLKQNFQPDGHHQLQVEEMDTIHKEQMLGIGMDAQHWPKNS